MDAVNILVSAIIAGASSALQDTTGVAIKDAYTALRWLIVQRYKGVDLDQLEKDPSSEARRTIVAEEVSKHPDMTQDSELRALAEDLLEKFKAEPNQNAAVGLLLEKLRAWNLTVDDVVSTGTGVIARDLVVENDAMFTRIRGGTGNPVGKS